MLIEDIPLSNTAKDIQCAVNTHTAVDYFQAHSQMVVDLIRTHKNSSEECSHQSVFNNVMQLIRQLVASQKPIVPGSDLIILLNNMFCLHVTAVEQLLFNKTSLQTLQNIVVEFCQRYTSIESIPSVKEKQQINRLNFELYSVMFFLTMLICQTNKHGNDLNLRIYFFNNRLISSLTTLQIPENTKPQLFKLLSTIMVYLVKRVIFGEQWAMAKNFCLAHLQHIKEGKTVFNYTDCLRSILRHQTISLQDIIKYKVIEFIHSSLNTPIDVHHSYCALESLKILITKNEYAKTKCIENNIVKKITEQFELQSAVVMGFIEEIATFIPQQQTELLYNRFEAEFFKQTDAKKQTLRVCAVLMRQLPIQRLFTVIEDGILDFLDNRIKVERNVQSYEIILCILQTVLHRTKQASPQLHMCVISKVESLDILQLALRSGVHIGGIAQSLQKQYNIL